jgi:hypothetical protein
LECGLEAASSSCVAEKFMSFDSSRDLKAATSQPSSKVHGMSISYDRIAGQSVERLAALSDGILAVAMTLMVLDLRLPAAEAIHGEHDFWSALGALLPHFWYN